MEDHESEPRPSGLRPPGPPGPPPGAVGFSPEFSGDGGDSLDLIVAELEKEDAEYDRSGALQGDQPSVPELVLPDVQRERLLQEKAEIEEQLELERTVARPPRSGFLPGHGDTGQVKVHEKRLAEIDRLISILDGGPETIGPSSDE